MQSLFSSYSHLYLYASESVLFVWSKTTASLYTFSNHYGALFFYMEENNNVDTATQYILSIGLKNTTKTKQIISTIHTLLNNTEENTFYKEAQLKRVPTVVNSTSLYKHYALYNSSFSLYVDDSIAKFVEVSFEHLLTSELTLPEYHFEVLNEHGIYNIYANGRFQESVEKKENILAVLQDTIRIIFYQNSDFLVAIHAAVLSYSGKTFIFPGISGAGKSTLSSFLMNRGFTLYSDEVTVVDSNYTIHSLALCNTIKEDSWEVVKKFNNTVDSLSIHKRFDGQRTKFLKPPATAKDPIEAQGAYIFFPTYKKGSSTVVRTIDIVEAISLISQAQYHLYNSKDAEVTKSFLKFLVSCQLYTISYSNLKSAQKAMQEVLKGD